MLIAVRLALEMATKRATADVPVLEARISKLRLGHTDVEDDQCCVCSRSLPLDNPAEYSYYVNIRDGNAQHMELFCLECDPMRHVFCRFGPALRPLCKWQAEGYYAARDKGLLESSANHDDPTRPWVVQGSFCYADNSPAQDSSENLTGIFSYQAIDDVLSNAIFVTPERQYTCALDLQLMLRQVSLAHVWTPADYAYSRMATQAATLLENALMESLLVKVETAAEREEAVDEVFKEWSPSSTEWHFNTAHYRALTGDNANEFTRERFAEQKQFYKRTAKLGSSQRQARAKATK